MAGQAVHVITAITDDDRLVNGTIEVVNGDITPLGDAYCYDLIVQAAPGNAGNVFLGGTNLATDGTNGIVLEAGESLPISAQNIGQVFVTGTDNDVVTFMYFTYRKAKQP